MHKEGRSRDKHLDICTVCFPQIVHTNLNTESNNRISGAVVLPTWLLHLDDWNEVLMERLGRFL